MKLTSFVPGAVGFNAAVKSGAAVQLNPVQSLVVGSGLPIWPHFVLQQAQAGLPDPRAVFAEARRAIMVAVPLVRAAGAGLQAGGLVATAFAPLAGIAGPALAPALNAIPYVGPALGVAATAAGPIVAVGGIAANVAGAAAGGSAQAGPALANLGQQVAEQLDELERKSTADDVIDVPRLVEV